MARHATRAGDVPQTDGFGQAPKGRPQSGALPEFRPLSQPSTCVKRNKLQTRAVRALLVDERAVARDIRCCCKNLDSGIHGNEAATDGRL